MDAYSTYLKNFKIAIQRSLEYGLDLPEIVIEKELFVNSNITRKIPGVLKKIGIVSYEQLYGTCLPVHHKAIYFIEEIVSTNCYLTIGNVSFEEKPIFTIDEHEIKERLKKKDALGRDLKLHAWLTLPSMEIFDLTLLTTVSMHKEGENRFGVPMAGTPNDALDIGILYEPYFIGEDLLRKAGGMLEYC